MHFDCFSLEYKVQLFQKKKEEEEEEIEMHFK